MNAASVPTVSVVMPAYNARAFIVEALNSVLSQGIDSLEILVVDDGSSDGTAEAAEAFGAPVKVLRQANAGPAAARNLGLAHARADVIAFLDADDVWLPGKLSAQLTCLAHRPDLGVVYGAFLRWTAQPDGSFLLPSGVPSHSKKLVVGPDSWIGDQLLFDNVVHIITAVVRRRVFDAVGCFDEALRTGEDYDFWLRVSSQFQAAKINDPVALYRIHAASTTQLPRLTNNEYEVLRRAIARRGKVREPWSFGSEKALMHRLADLCFSHGYMHFWHGDRRVAAAAFSASLRHVWKSRTLAYLALSKLPMGAVSRRRR